MTLAGLLSEGDRAALAGLAVALGVGLLVGVERERRKRERPSQAGLRTFAIAALSGAVATHAAGPAGLLVATAVIGGLTAVSVWSTRTSEDPGLTTEAALVAVTLDGGLAMTAPALAAMIGAVLAILLAARAPLHRFVGSVLTPREVSDALVLAGATLVVLPLLPDRGLGPFAVVNPREIWLLVILVLSVGAAGHAAVRLVGARYGLPLAGLLGGFVSSSATIGAMGARARSTPEEAAACAAGAVLSTVATMAQMALVLAAVSPETLREAAPSLAAAGAVAVAFGVASTLRALAQPATATGDDAQGAFSLLPALGFAAMLACVLWLAAAARVWLGGPGVTLAAGLAGVADAHAAAISVAALVAAGGLSSQAALIPILTGLSANTAAKLAMAAGNGGRGFLLRVGPGLLLVTAALWAPVLVAGR